MHPSIRARFDGPDTCNGAVSDKLDQVPAVAERVLEHSDGAVRLMARGFFKRDASGAVRRKIAVEIVGFKDQPDTPATLVANGRDLVWRGGFGDQERCFGPLGCHFDPAFVTLICIFQQIKPQLPDKEIKPRLITGHKDRQCGQPLVIAERSG